MERKLAAILAADVVGYSALMERDEKGTYERLKAGRTELLPMRPERTWAGPTRTSPKGVTSGDLRPCTSSRFG